MEENQQMFNILTSVLLLLLLNVLSEEVYEAIGYSIHMHIR